MATEVKTEDTPQVLAYVTPGDSEPRKVFRFNKLAYVLELIFVAIGSRSGIGSDFITIPLHKKVAITVAGFAIGLLALTGLLHGKLLHMVFICVASSMIFVMWFWN